MTVRDLKVLPKDEQFLRTPSVDVTFDGLTTGEDGEVRHVVPEHVKELINDMFDTMEAYGAAGISAVQVGEHLRVIAVMDDTGNPVALINPHIVRKEELVSSTREGCLSLPGVFESIKNTRYNEIEVHAVTADGYSVHLNLTGEQAVAVQHEIDHLDGKLFIDYLGKTSKRLALKRLSKVRRRIDIAKQRYKDILGVA